jgi:transposase
MSKNRYSTEFKKEAARLIIIDGMSVAEASKKLGVSTAQLYKWRDAHLEGLAGEAGASGQASPMEMASELDSLRKRLRKAERVNEILKKTVSFFSKDEI